MVAEISFLFGHLTHPESESVGLAAALYWNRIAIATPLGYTKPLQSVGGGQAGCGNLAGGLELLHRLDCVVVVLARSRSRKIAQLDQRLLNFGHPFSRNPRSDLTAARWSVLGYRLPLP